MNKVLRKRWTERFAANRFDGRRGLLEGEIRALVKAMNHSEDDASDLYDMLLEARPVYVLPEQARKGLTWLRNTVFDIKGNVRRARSDTSTYVIATLRTCLESADDAEYLARCYTLHDIHNLNDAGRNRSQYAPVYKLTTPNGDSVLYAAVAWQTGTSFFF